MGEWGIVGIEKLRAKRTEYRTQPVSLRGGFFVIIITKIYKHIFLLGILSDGIGMKLFESSHNGYYPDYTANLPSLLPLNHDNKGDHAIMKKTLFNLVVSLALC